MRDKIECWWNTTNEPYSKMAGTKTTNGNIVQIVFGIAVFTLVLGLARIIETGGWL